MRHSVIPENLKQIFDFQDRGCMPCIGFLEIKNLFHLRRAYMRHPLLRYRVSCDFQDGGRCHLGFLKFTFFNGQGRYDTYSAAVATAPVPSRKNSLCINCFVCELL